MAWTVKPGKNLSKIGGVLRIMGIGREFVFRADRANEVLNLSLVDPLSYIQHLHFGVVGSHLRQGTLELIETSISENLRLMFADAGRRLGIIPPRRVDAAPKGMARAVMVVPGGSVIDHSGDVVESQIDPTFFGDALVIIGGDAQPQTPAIIVPQAPVTLPVPPISPVLPPDQVVPEEPKAIVPPTGLPEINGAPNPGGSPESTEPVAKAWNADMTLAEAEAHIATSTDIEFLEAVIKTDSSERLQEDAKDRIQALTPESENQKAGD
jgi:hypothetical protein